MSAPAAPAENGVEEEFKPYVPASEERRELTVRALVIGSLLGIVFGASTVYLGLKVGLTVSASIPIAVLSIPIFRALGKGSILENNITQTVGSAAESIAAGTAFTVPALLVMGYDLNITRSTLVALTGGWLGVLLMVPLRRSLIVKEHKNLPYPEGTACAEVLEAGEKKGLQARLVFLGVLVGILHKGLYKILGLWKETPGHVFGKPIKNAAFNMEASPELLGVGYIIGPKIAGTMIGGGVLAFMVLIPLIHFLGMKLATGDLQAEFAAGGGKYVRDNYVFYIAVGAVVAGGFISLGKALPTIVRTFGAAMKGLKSSGVAAGGAGVPRTERDLPITVTIGGSIAIAVLVALIPQLHVTWTAAILIVVFGFFFTTVSSRICGQIGSSSNPISGMTLATLLLTSLLFVAAGWTGSHYRPIALTVGAIVCVAAANAGATSQDLKTGFLVGATPKRQQLALLVGVSTSALVVGWTVYFINLAYTTVEPVAHPKIAISPEKMATLPVAAGPDGKQLRVLAVAADQGHAGGQVLIDEKGFIRDWRIDVPAGAETRKGLDDKDYRVVRFAGDPAAEVPYGEFLVDETGAAHYAMSPGIKLGGAKGGQAFDIRPESAEKKFEAPKAQLMALIIDGILLRKLEVTLVLLGVLLGICLELAGVEALPFAVGLYLPIGTSSSIFAGGILRWIVGRVQKRRGAAEEGDAGRGVLLSSGLIAGGALCGLLAGAVVFARGGKEYSLAHSIGGTFADIANSNLLAVIMFGVLAAFVLWQALRKEEA